jgi:hypothetical protein
MSSRAVKYRSTDLSPVRAATNIPLLRAADRPTETTVDIYLTAQQYIPEVSEHHTRCHENLKSQHYFT